MVIIKVKCSVNLFGCVSWGVSEQATVVYLLIIFAREMVTAPKKSKGEC